MTTFEIFVSIALAIIVGCAVITVCTVIEGFRGVWKNQDEMYQRQNIIKDDLMRVRERVMHLTIIDDKLDKIIFPTTQFPPCYAPDGICMNPYGDCINCPKKGDGGTWTANTSIKAEDAPLQERFNNNKKD